MREDPAARIKPNRRLQLTDAAVAIIQHDDGRYLMQRRDDIPEIPYPDYWGLFGGSIDPGETPGEALIRELQEELEFRPRETTYFTRFEFDLAPMGLRQCYREFHVVPITDRELASVVQHEGAGMRLFSAPEILSHGKVTPYDVYALWLHHNTSTFYV